MRKFGVLRRLLVREGIVRRADVVEPEPAPWWLLGRVHGEGYLDRLRCGALDVAAERRMRLPWSPNLVIRSRLAVGGTLRAAEMALEDGLAANLAGGTHHAFPGYGEGFCVLNDVAVTVRELLRRRSRRILVVDLDTHQGNGTAVALAGEPRAYTLSVHARNNYPREKPPSSLDVELPDRPGDQVYLDAIESALGTAFEDGRPDLVFYLAGVDVVEGDRYGRLRISEAALAERERLVLETCVRRGTPTVLLLAGGYASSPERTAVLHSFVHRRARAILDRNGDRPVDPTIGTGAVESRSP